MKKVKMRLIGLDGNGFAIMGRFQKEARRQGWPQREIDRVINLCKSGDYNNLLQVILKYTFDPDEDFHAEIQQREEESDRMDPDDFPDLDDEDEEYDF